MSATRRKQNSQKCYVGVDAGSVSINCVVINQDREILYEFPYRRHYGRLEGETISLLREVIDTFGEDNIFSVAFTGNHGKKLSEKLGVFYEFETISQVVGVLFIRPDAKTIISMGGQDTALFQIKHLKDSWELEYFNTNGLCASGTGSFIDQQAERLATAMYERKEAPGGQIDKTLYDFIGLGLQSTKPADVACRCTVFTKSDMIHLQNKGEKLEDIIYGLHVGNARNYISTIVSTRSLEEPILFVGGLSINALQVKAFRTYFPGIIVPQHSTSTGAIGVALKCLELKREDGLNLSALETATADRNLALPTASRLLLKKTKWADTSTIQGRPLPEKLRGYLGVGIGSTTTK